MSKYDAELKAADRLRRFVVCLGICPDCGKRIVHAQDEPLADCGCGVMEWAIGLPLMESLPEGVNRDLLALWEKSA